MMNIQGHSVRHINVEEIVGSIFGDSQHKKRIKSMANAALGVISSASLITHRIGRGMAAFLKLTDKHAIKQVDRLLSNKMLDTIACQKNWVSYVIGERKELVIAMDWTDFDSDLQVTLSLSLVTSHGRATPLLWRTFSKLKLQDCRNEYEDQLLHQLRESIPENVKVTLLADRGFFDTKLFEYITKTLKFHYIIRIRKNVLVENQAGESRAASEWITATGKSKTIRDAKITKGRFKVPVFVCLHDKNMKEAWCIAGSDETLSGSGMARWYSKRWGCEPQFRDIKDIHLGMGLSKTHIKNPERRDRLLLIHAISTAILTFLGAAGENLGLSRYLKANTVKKRTMSLLNQGIIYFERIPNMTQESAEKLLNEFCNLIDNNRELNEILGVI